MSHDEEQWVHRPWTPDDDWPLPVGTRYHHNKDFCEGGLGTRHFYSLGSERWQYPGSTACVEFYLSFDDLGEGWRITAGIEPLSAFHSSNEDICIIEKGEVE